MRILYYKVNNLEKSIIASSLPKTKNININIKRELSVKDLQHARMLATAPSGSGHDCFLKGINVFMVIQAPLTFWKQWDRYHFQDTVSSSSTMHMVSHLSPAELREWLPDCIYPEVGIRLTQDIKRLNTNITTAEKKEIWNQIIQNLPQGLLYTRAVTLNYLQIKSMIRQRTEHKLYAWKKLIDCFHSMPYVVEWFGRGWPHG